MQVPKRVTVIQGVKCMGVSGNRHIGVDDDSLQSLLVVWEEKRGACNWVLSLAMKSNIWSQARPFIKKEGRNEGVEASWYEKRMWKPLEMERRYQNHSRKRSPGTIRVALFVVSKLYACGNSSHSTRRTAKWKCNGQNNKNQAMPIYAVSTLIELISILLLWCPTPNWLCTRKYRHLPT